MNPQLIPKIVYVGDRALLVLPLPGAVVPGGRDAVISLEAKDFPSAPDIDFYRIALEYRAAGSRLVVEFSAYTPGNLVLPPIEIGGERFSGLTVTVSSIIAAGEAGAVLSGPASPLSIPGTGLLVYGTMGGFMLILLLSLWAAFWGRRHLKGWLVKWKRRRLIVSMSGIEKRLRKAMLKYGDKRDILNTLSGEFRSFLSFFTGKNCQAMTAGELGYLDPMPPPQLPAAGNSVVDDNINNDDNKAAPDASSGGLNARYEAAAEILSGDFLGGFFSRCDRMRFGGSIILGDEVIAVLGDLRRFLWTLDRIERGKIRRREAA